MDKLRSLRFFIATLDGGSFVAAAKAYGTDPSTVSKAINRLESELGVSLFQRSTRQLHLTEFGEHYAVTVRKLIDELSSCEEALRQHNDAPSGQLRINVPISYGRLYIRPLLREFHLRYPDIKVELHYDDAYVDIIEQGFDLSIRTGSLKDSRLVGREISPIDFVICASQTYLEKNGFPRSRQHFRDYAWIRFRYQQTGKLAPIMSGAGKERGKEKEFRDDDPDRTFIVGDGEALAELCADGLGIAQMPHFIARNWLNSGAIVPLYPSYYRKGFDVHVMYAKRKYLPARVRLFVAYLMDAINAQGESPGGTWARALKCYQPRKL